MGVKVGLQTAVYIIFLGRLNFQGSHHTVDELCLFGNTQEGHLQKS